MLLTFQASAFDRSATSPLGPQGYRRPPQLSNRFGTTGGIDSGHPGPRPAGALRASKIAPAILSNPRTRLGVTHFPGVRLRPLGHLSTRAARVPEAAPAIKSVVTPSPRRAPTPGWPPCSAGPAC